MSTISQICFQRRIIFTTVEKRNRRFFVFFKGKKALTICHVVVGILEHNL